MFFLNQLHIYNSNATVHLLHTYGLHLPVSIFPSTCLCQNQRRCTTHQPRRRPASPHTPLLQARPVTRRSSSDSCCSTLREVAHGCSWSCTAHGLPVVISSLLCGSFLSSFHLAQTLPASLSVAEAAMGVLSLSLYLRALSLSTSFLFLSLGLSLSPNQQAELASSFSSTLALFFGFLLGRENGWLSYRIFEPIEQCPY